uniref:Uncharacterized protein ycf35 n=1 Tax=Osmundea sinicola TaxID=290685 RepID=A0A7L4WP34_9FLOR|nr:hypothetical protein [Osmundea sinicola]QFR99817.1 hypothetical protein [Osmundea sinicola]
MSHFSKIKTNIANNDMLTTTLSEMGFIYKYSTDAVSQKDIFVYTSRDITNHVFSFIWNGSNYNLLADVNSWSLDVDFNCFIDSLSQIYAYNIILNQSCLNGFSKVSEKTATDGSIKIKLKRWSTSNLS